MLSRKDDGLKRLLDPKSRVGSGELSIRVIEGQGMAKMDGRGGSSDPFVRLTCCGKTVQTAVVRGSLNPKWDQEFLFQIVGGMERLRMDNLVQMEVYDWDAVCLLLFVL